MDPRSTRFNSAARFCVAWIMQGNGVQATARGTAAAADLKCCSALRCCSPLAANAETVAQQAGRQAARRPGGQPAQAPVMSSARMTPKLQMSAFSQDRWPSSTSGAHPAGSGRSGRAGAAVFLLGFRASWREAWRAAGWEPAGENGAGGQGRGEQSRRRHPQVKVPMRSSGSPLSWLSCIQLHAAQRAGQHTLAGGQQAGGRSRPSHALPTLHASSREPSGLQDRAPQGAAGHSRVGAASLQRRSIPPPTHRLNPTSAILAVPSLASRMLAGFTSRCTRPGDGPEGGQEGGQQSAPPSVSW